MAFLFCSWHLNSHGIVAVMLRFKDNEKTDREHCSDPWSYDFNCYAQLDFQGLESFLNECFESGSGG